MTQVGVETVLVLDCSAAMDAVLRHGRADVVLEAVMRAGKVISSELFRAEAANVLWKYHRANALNTDQCRTAYGEALDLVDEFEPLADGGLEALMEAARLGHLAYDMLYLNLARKTGATLATSDNKLRALAQSEHIPVLPREVIA